MFKPKYELSTEKKVTKSFVIANDTEITVGDAVTLDAGFVALGAGASDDILGVVVDIVNEDGTPLVTDGTVGAELGSYRLTYTVAADNETVAKVKAVVNTSTTQVYEVELDAAAGTTTGSDLIGAKFDLANETSLDESTVGAVGATFQVVGFDTQSDTTVFAKIAESSIDR